MDDPIRVWAIVSESALRSVVGSNLVMAEQLNHLQKVSQLPHVQLQVHPFSAGAAPARGLFAILRFLEQADPEAVYAEQVICGLKTTHRWRSSWPDGRGSSRRRSRHRIPSPPSPRERLF
ncbi:Scr1 family TA system antitoxin-like transcriptional regulator [Spirillospora sp. CA-128828]|uniref:Scr1 family TA system antitoxin-like transcriptional regulator n=1 Tax=Spirillospora sp. CA-128828 TaxID=3240033 RepID=UPI003D8EA976